MSEATTFSDILSQLPQVDCNVFLGSQSNTLVKMSLRSVANLAFSSISNSEDLDNPTTRGVFNINDNTVITRPLKGTGWRYGYVINIASPTGVQVWVNFDGYIAVRGKGSSGGEWSEWKVMQPM